MIGSKAIGTLVAFIVSIFFVIHPIYPPPVPYTRGWLRIPINLTTAPIVAIFILWAAKCIDGTVIRNGIVGTQGVKPFNIIILFFSLAYMAITLDVTGILQSAAYWVSNKGGANGWKLYFYFYVMLTLLSVLLGNDPVILSGTAFLVYYTQVVDELQPLPWLITEFAAANTASMVLFVGNPTNVVICEGFSVNNAAFTAYTIFPFIACNVACFIALAFQYRSEKHIPRQITPTQLDVRSVLRDSVSAWVGSVWLGTCLVVIIVVSFFKVDVWKISFPFAGIKFLFDLSWDYYRSRKATSIQDRGELGEKTVVSDSRRETAGSNSTSKTLTNGPMNGPNIEIKPHSPDVKDMTTDVKQHSMPDRGQLGEKTVVSDSRRDTAGSTSTSKTLTNEPMNGPNIEIKPHSPDVKDMTTDVKQHLPNGLNPTTDIQRYYPHAPDPTNVVGDNAPHKLDTPSGVEQYTLHESDVTLDAERRTPHKLDVASGVEQYAPHKSDFTLDVERRAPHKPGLPSIIERNSLDEPDHNTNVRQPSLPDQVGAKDLNSTPTAIPLLQRLSLSPRFYTFNTALPRLPFALVPFAFSQFILIEALTHQGWIDVFAHWLVRASNRQIYPTIWIIGVLGVILCNISGTNIGATILLTNVVRAADMPDHTLRAAAIALAVASNIGAVSFTFSASLAGLLWRSILDQKGIHVRQRDFARWNILPILAMTAVGLAVVSAEMAVLYRGKVS